MTTCFSSACAVILQRDFTYVPSKFILHSETYTVSEAHKHPSYSPTPRKVAMQVISKMPAVATQSPLCSMQAEEVLCINMQRFALLRHHCVLKEHVTTVREVTFLKQTTPIVLVAAEIQTPRAKNKNTRE